MQIQSMNESSVTAASLYNDYHQSILHYLNSLISDYEAAEDLCHETFLRVINHWDQRNSQGSAVGWMYRIATNIAYDYLRRKRCIRFLSLHAPVYEVKLTSVHLDIDERIAIDKVLSQLPERYRTPFLLYTCAGYKMEDSATAYGCSNEAIRICVYRARRRFYQLYIAQEGMRQGARILIVDDDRKTVDLIKMYMEREYYHVLVAYDGYQALELTRHTNPELIVIDLMLPAVDGLDVCRTAMLIEQSA